MHTDCSAISSSSLSSSATLYHLPASAALTPSPADAPLPTFASSSPSRALSPAPAGLCGGKRLRDEQNEERQEEGTMPRAAEQSPSPQQQEDAGSRPRQPLQRFTASHYVHSTRQRAQQEKQHEQEEKRQQEAEQERQRRQQRRQRRLASLSSRLSSSQAARGSRHACRELSRPETARVAIIGGGPAGLSAAYHLLLDGYSDVQILEARDRLGGRVNTLQLSQLVHSAAQQRRRQLGRQQQQDDDAELQRLQSLLTCSALGVVDEGAAFIHGYKQPNPMRAIFPREEVRRKSEGNEQWWDSGTLLLPEIVDTARDIYELVSDRVLDAVETEETQREMESGSRGEEGSGAAAVSALSDDRSVAECFAKELDGFWQRRQQLRERGDDSDSELRLWRIKRNATREQEESSDSDSGSDSSFFSSPPSSFSPDLSNARSSTVAPSSSSSSSSPRSREEELKRILAALSTSQHCYVAAGSELSARDLLHCANEPPLVTPEMVPSRGYGWLTHWLLARLTERRAPTPRLGCQVTRVEERPLREQSGQEMKAQETEREGCSESCYVEVTALQAENGKEERLIADYVIVTAPIGVLRQGSIAFSPPLSTVHPRSAPSVSRDECIRQLRMGRESKVILCWSAPWWRQQEQMQYFRSPAHPCIKIINLAALKTSRHTLVIHFAPPLAAAVEAMPTADAAVYAVGILRSMFGSHVPGCDFCHVTRWGRDEWSLGSYSYVPVGSSSSYSGWLADISCESRLLFAGEHCAGGDMQTVHGAYRSGEQAARRVKLLVAQHGLREAEHRQVRQAAEQELRDERNRQAKQESAQAAARVSLSVPAAYEHEEHKAEGGREDAELQQEQKQEEEEEEDRLPLSSLRLLPPFTSSSSASPAASGLHRQSNAQPTAAAADSAAPPSSLAALFSSTARQQLPAFLDQLASSVPQQNDCVSTTLAEQQPAPSRLSPSSPAAAASSSLRNPWIEAMDADDERKEADAEKPLHAGSAGQHRKRMWPSSDRTQAKAVVAHGRSRLPLVAAAAP